MKSICLCYHNVYLGAPETGIPRGASMYHISLDSFERQIQAIKDSRHAVRTVSEYAKNRMGDSIVITFDDGWRGTFEHALPVLRAAGLRATFFITRDLIGREHFADEAFLREAANLGMEIGVHGTTHRLLSTCKPEELLWEFNTCRTWLEQLLGRDIRSASAPGGDWNPHIAVAARDSKLWALCTSRPGVNLETRSPFELSRVAIKDSTSLADCQRYCRFDVRKEQARCILLNIPRRLLGMKRYSELRSKIYGNSGM